MIRKFNLYLFLYWVGVLIGCQTSTEKSANEPNLASVPDAAPAPAVASDAGRPQEAAPPEDPSHQANFCPTAYQTPEDYFALPGTLLLEISGLAPSNLQDGLFWAHNDSGDAAQVYGVDEQGNHRATLLLNGVTARDFEDMASGSCPQSDAPCLYVADVGDNRHQRSNLHVYVIEEPSLEGLEHGTVLQRDVMHAFNLTFDGLKPNIEGFAVEQERKLGLLFEKTEDAAARLFTFSLTGDANQHVPTLGTFPNPAQEGLSGQNNLITSAAYHNTAKRLLLKTYGAIYEYRFFGGKTVDDLGDVEPVLVSTRPNGRLQGEAITYSFGGDDVISASEDPMEQGGQTVYRMRCLTQP